MQNVSIITRQKRPAPEYWGVAKKQSTFLFQTFAT